MYLSELGWECGGREEKKPQTKLEPMVADFVDRNNVDRLINPALLSNTKTRIAAQSLNIHAADFETDAFKQKAIIIYLDTPIE